MTLLLSSLTAALDKEATSLWSVTGHTAHYVLIHQHGSSASPFQELKQTNSKHKESVKNALTFHSFLDTKSLAPWNPPGTEKDGKQRLISENNSFHISLIISNNRTSQYTRFFQFPLSYNATIEKGALEVSPKNLISWGNALLRMAKLLMVYEPKFCCSAICVFGFRYLQCIVFVKQCISLTHYLTS